MKGKTLKLLEQYKTEVITKGQTAGTIEGKMNDLGLLFGYFQDKPVKKLTHEDMIEFLGYLRDERENSAAAVNRKISTLKNFFETMIDLDYLDMKNPMRKISKMKEAKKVRQPITVEQYKAMMEYAKERNNIRGLALMSLLFSSGVRISEAVGLNRDSLDYTKMQVIVFGKGQKERRTIFSEEAGQYVKEYLESRTDECECMFFSRNHNRWDAKTIEDYIKGIGNELGFIATPHRFRHGFATLLLQKKVPITTIQLFLGHTSVATTQVYTHQDIDEAQEQVGDIFKNIAA